MDTIYYNLNTRKIKVSGGADLLTFVPTPAEAPAGEVLDFDLCRRRLETKAAWKDLEKAAAPAQAPAAPAPRPRRERASNLLELAASLAVLAVSVAAAAAFFGLL